ncbi:MurR/RpiR family transcriptional regulator [Ureibacillus sp. GCM10028918]|uniref:MurR/RpiR family transcriptional regulator n=1 Tax=Ureibacillus sp. GCM10028918 TaxID=3273429 RepID=UPI00360DC4C0
MTVNVLRQLEEKMDNLTNLQKKTADYILKNPMEAAFSTIEQIAQTLDISTTTIVRLTLFLGYTGYTDFQHTLQNFLKSSTVPSTKMEINMLEASSKSNLMMEITQRVLKNITNTYDKLDYEQVLKVVEQIKYCRNIYVVGTRSSFGVAHNFSFNLDRIFNNCNFLDSNSGDIPEKIRRITHEDMLFIFGMSRYSKATYKIGNLVHEKGTKVVVITDGYHSPFAKHADYLFIADRESVDFRNSMMASSLIAEIIIGVCTIQNQDYAKENLQESELNLKLLDSMMHDNI